MNIENAKYHCLDGDNTKPKVSIACIINGVKMSVPLDPNNIHYAEILKQVDAGTLTIADAD